MAEKRMFTNRIVSSDPFKEMPLSTQALYFHLGMNADDEGFLNNAKSVQRSIMASDDDMKLLIAKNFIIPFESGVMVIKHWKMNNTIPPTRLKATQYTEEKALLSLKENGAYTLADILQTNCRQIADNCIQNADEIRLDEISIDKNRVEEERVEPEQPAPPPTLTYESLIQKYGKAFVDERIERSKKYTRTHNIETVAKWCEEDYKKQKPKNNRFNDINHREYDMEALEKQLISTQAKQMASDEP